MLKSSDQIARPSESSDDPILSFYDSELTTCLDLAQLIQCQLEVIGKFLRGSLALTNDVQIVANSLAIGETPTAWESQWEGPTKASKFISELVRKCFEIQKLRKETPKSIELNSFLSPVTWLNALRQLTSRKCNYF